MEWLARVHLPDGGILTLTGRGWAVDNPEYEPERLQAEFMSSPPLYEYSAADGAPGVLIAHRVAQKVGGRVEIAPFNRVQEVGLMY